jgi:serine/threonine-protein kinase
VIESSLGPLLIYHWVPGELLSAPREQREDPTSAYQRFRGLPSYTIERCLDAIFDLHAQLERSGWIASDFYDGCLLYDFSNQRLTVIDLDTYHEGPFRNTMGRMFGSTRFMAPEEFVLDALIDERTTVFVMGRTALLFLSDGTLDPHAFRGSRERLDVVTRACEADPARRFRSMADFREAWQAAQSHHHVSKR